MRISGIASGFDTEEMVRQLMQVERMKVDRVEQNRQTILWRQESYNNINKAFANFILNTQKDMGLKKSGITGALFNNSYKDLDYVKRGASSNEDVATARANSKDVDGSYTFTVNNLAEGARLSGSKGKEDFGPELTFELKTGEKYTDKAGNIHDIVKKITVKESVKDAGVSMEDIAKEINSTKVWTLNGKNIDYDELSDEDKKNAKEVPLGINAFYVEDSKGEGNLFLETTATGEKAKIEISSGDPEGKKFAEIMGHSAQGKDSKITLNDVEITFDSNDITLNGLNIQLKAEGTTTIEVSTNTEGIMDKIEKLVADYNNLIDLTSGLVNEKVYRDYKPLSQEDRKALSEEDLKLWDEKAKSGLLNRDETLQKILQNIRVDLYKDVEGLEGSFYNITQLGITTEKYSKGSVGGKLQIDTDKLRKAIEEDPEGVMELLFNEPGALSKEGYNLSKNNPEYEKELGRYEAADKAHRNSSGGIFTRVYDDLMEGMKNIIDKSGPGEDSDLYRNVKSNMLLDFVTKKSSISDLDKSVMDMNKQIDNLNILLARREETHYAKFTAMEKAMYQMQNQSGWLMQQFG